MNLRELINAVENEHLRCLMHKVVSTYDKYPNDWFLVGDDVIHLMGVCLSDDISEADKAHVSRVVDEILDLYNLDS